MDAQQQAPRVNGKYMTKYVGRMVSLMCENIRNNENGAVVKASDGVEITVALPPGESINGKYVHVEGKVSNGNHIEAFRLTPAGDSFDMTNYNQTVELINTKFEYLFA